MPVNEDNVVFTAAAESLSRRTKCMQDSETHCYAFGVGAEPDFWTGKLCIECKANAFDIIALQCAVCRQTDALPLCLLAVLLPCRCVCTCVRCSRLTASASTPGSKTGARSPAGLAAAPRHEQPLLLLLLRQAAGRMQMLGQARLISWGTRL